MIVLGVGIGRERPVYGPVQKKKPNPWPPARRATLVRDGNRCRKCFATDDLEVHHIKPRVYGGTDELSNLVTLCGACHDEVTYAEQPASVMSFETWLTLPPARILVAIFNSDWPSTASAADLKKAILAAAREVFAR